MNKLIELDQVNQELSEIHFTVKYPGIHKYKVSIYDDESLLPVCVFDNWELSENSSYYIIPAIMDRYLTKISFIVELEELIQKETVILAGSYRSPVVNGKKIFFNHINLPAFYTLMEVFYDKIYDRDFVKIEKDDVVVDIGANLGMFSVYAQNFNPSKVVAVEPSPKEYECLEKNVSSFNNIKCYKYAVSDKSGTINFLLAEGGVSNRIYNPETQNNFFDAISQEIFVNAISLNDLIAQENLDKIDYLKVDCEGAEFEIFNSLDQSFLQNKIKKVAIEYHSKTIKNDLLNLFLSNGFILENIEILNENSSEIGMFYFYNQKLFKF
jgi:FkbM family methyltransferase